MTYAPASNAFSRASRLDGRHAFASVFAFKCSTAGDYFQVYARPNRDAEARLGVTVNKRFVPLAVARNFTKRLAREAFRLNRAELAGVDFVVRARRQIPRHVSEKARAEIVRLMQRAKHSCVKDNGAVPPR